MQRYRILERAYEEGRLPTSFVIQGDCGCGGEDGPGLPIETFDVPAPPGPGPRARTRRQGGGMGGKLGQKPKTEAIEKGGDPRMEWGAELRRFAATERVRQISMRRPNRRQPERIGEIPGYQRRPTLSKLLIAIDTSGSMHKQIFQAIDGELSGLADLATLEICEVDDEIRRTYAYKGRLRDIQGRGGTDFHPVFASAFLAKRRGLSGIVYFTDGKGPFPKVGPRIPVLWVLIGQRPFKCPWGGQVRLRT